MTDTPSEDQIIEAIARSLAEMDGKDFYSQKFRHDILYRRTARSLLDRAGLLKQIRALEARAREIAAERDEARAAIASAEAERDEADRRAGAAERRSANLEKSDVLRSQWLARAKRERGYPDATSFDTVWAETCAAADRALALESQEQGADHDPPRAASGRPWN